MTRRLRQVAFAAFALASAAVDAVRAARSVRRRVWTAAAGRALRRKAFATSDEHYKYLLEQAKGGTKHTLASVPRWDGLWVTAGNTHMDIFIDPPGFHRQGSRQAC